MARGWIGPFELGRLAEGARDFGGVAARVRGRLGWLGSVLVAGVLPLALAAPAHSSAHQAVSAILAFALLIAAVQRGDQLAGILTLPAIFGAHCGSAILLARCFPEVGADCFPDGADYWRQSLTWIQTGSDPEYDPANWVPEHLQLAVVVCLSSYLSLGLIPILRGFHEVDLMNYYVGRLLAASDDAPMSLLLGWHPWSLARGFAYSVLIYEIVAWSYRRLTSRGGGPSREPVADGPGHQVGPRRSWLSVGLLLLIVDGLLKLVLLDPVRRTLAAGLLEGVHV